MTNLMYVSPDGNYGDADGLVLIDCTDWTDDDVIDMDAARDDVRPSQAAALAAAHNREPIVWAWLTDDEAAQVHDTLAAAITILTADGNVGLAEQIGDIRDVLTRSNIHPDEEM